MIKTRKPIYAPGGSLPEGSMLAGLFSQPNYAYETKGLSGGGDGVDLVNLGGQALKYLIPAARLIGNERAMQKLRSQAQFKFQPVNLMRGAVRDIPRPNFGLRYREPQGSSLMEQIAGQKFGDAQQRDAEANYNIQNALSRIEQQNKQVDVANQENMVNTDMANRAKAMNAQNANYQQLLRMGQQEDLELGLTETALNDVTQRNYLQSSQQASAAADILRYGTPGTPEYQSALSYYMNTINGNKLGSKKTKFNAR